MLLKKRQLKDFVNQSEVRVSKEYIEAVNEELKSIIKKSIKRASENGRKTTYSRDL